MKVVLKKHFVKCVPERADVSLLVESAEPRGGGGAKAERLGRKNSKLIAN